MRPNILVIFTGGTIGSALDGAYIAPSAEKPYALLEWYKSNYNTDVDFHTQAPYTLLSENLTGTYISRLLQCVAGGIREGYDGIIVTASVRRLGCRISDRGVGDSGRVCLEQLCAGG